MVGALLAVNSSRVRIPAAPLSSATLGKLLTHTLASVTKQYELSEYCTNLHKVFYYSIIVFIHLIFFTFVSCLSTVTFHIVDVRLTCLINITYLLTYNLVPANGLAAGKVTMGLESH